MQLLKNLALLIAITLISLNFAFANPTTAAMQFGKLLFDAAKLQDSLVKNGLSKQEAIQLSRYTKVALESLDIKNDDQLLKYVNAINDPSMSLDVKIKMSSVLNQPSTNRDDVISTLDNLYYLAGRHGKSGAFFAVCAACTNDSTIKGLKYVLQDIKSGTAENILVNMIKNKDAKKLSKELGQKLSKYDVQGATELAPVDERPLAMFIELGNSGSPNQMKYYKAVMKLSETGSKQYGDLLEHRLWNNLDFFDNSELLPEWTKLIDDVASERKNTPSMSVEEAWNKVLTRRAAGDPDKLEKVSRMKVKNCFMKK